MCDFINNLEAELSLKKRNQRIQLNQERELQYQDNPLLPRVPIDKTPHVSGCLSFVGDDLDKKSRNKQQFQQMSVWIHEQVYQREESKRILKEEEMYYLIFFG